MLAQHTPLTSDVRWGIGCRFGRHVRLEDQRMAVPHASRHQLPVHEREDGALDDRKHTLLNRPHLERGESLHDLPSVAEFRQDHTVRVNHQRARAVPIVVAWTGWVV